jgi:hypothetical protein
VPRHANAGGSDRREARKRTDAHRQQPRAINCDLQADLIAEATGVLSIRFVPGSELYALVEDALADKDEAAHTLALLIHLLIDLRAVRCRKELRCFLRGRPINTFTVIVLITAAA